MLNTKNTCKIWEPHRQCSHASMADKRDTCSESPWLSHGLYVAWQCHAATRLEVVETFVISQHYVFQEAVTFHFISWTFLAGIHLFFLQFRIQVCMQPPCKHFMKQQHVMDDMVSLTTTHVQGKQSDAPLCVLPIMQPSLHTLLTSQRPCCQMYHTHVDNLLCLNLRLIWLAFSIRQDELSYCLLIEVCALYYQPSCYNCLHLKIIFSL